MPFTIFPMRRFLRIAKVVIHAWFGLAVAGVFPSLVTAGVGEGVYAETCDRAARVAAKTHGIPLDVLRAITRTETGRLGDLGLTPWPWTVNMEGAGRWFTSRDDALAYVFKHFKTGARSFDVGCFQLNFKWHGAAFRSIEDMFDPETNARYAAKFLKDLYGELGDWSAAAGAYHSRTPSYARVYVARFDEIRANLEASPVRSANTGQAPLIAARQPMFGGGSSRMGSLVALDQIGSRPLIQMKTE